MRSAPGALITPRLGSIVVGRKLSTTRIVIIDFPAAELRKACRETGYVESLSKGVDASHSASAAEQLLWMGRACNLQIVQLRRWPASVEGASFKDSRLEAVRQDFCKRLSFDRNLRLYLRRLRCASLATLWLSVGKLSLSRTFTQLTPSRCACCEAPEASVIIDLCQTEIESRQDLCLQALTFAARHRGPGAATNHEVLQCSSCTLIFG